MDHNRAASHIWVFPDDGLTAGHQAESIRRLADALGMTIVREYEDEEYGSGPDGRPQFHRMMDAALSESRPFGVVTSYGRWRFAPCAADPAKYVRELQDAGVELLYVRALGRQGAPRRPRARRSGGGGRPEGRGNRRRLTLLQYGRQPSPAPGLSNRLYPTHHPGHIRNPPCTAETDGPVTRARSKGSCRSITPVSCPDTPRVIRLSARLSEPGFTGLWDAHDFQSYKSRNQRNHSSDEQSKDPATPLPRLPAPWIADRMAAITARA